MKQEINHACVCNDELEQEREDETQLQAVWAYGKGASNFFLGTEISTKIGRVFLTVTRSYSERVQSLQQDLEGTQLHCISLLMKLLNSGNCILTRSMCSFWPLMQMDKPWGQLQSICLSSW